MKIINPPNNDTTNEPATEGYDVHGSRFISEGYELFKKNALYFVAYTLLLAGIEAIFSRSDYRVNLLGLLYPVFSAGYFIVASKLDRDETPEFKDFFKGINKFLPLFIAGVLSYLLVAIGLVLLIIPGIYLAVAYMFAIPFIIFRNDDFWPALENSRKVISEAWFSFFGFGLILISINILGFLCIGVGLLVSIPVTYTSLYCAYKDIVNKSFSPEATV